MRGRPDDRTHRDLPAATLADHLGCPLLTGDGHLANAPRIRCQPIFQGAADFDLELVECRTLDAKIQELTYRPTLHRRT